MSRKCRKIRDALVLMAFAAFLCIAVHYEYFSEIYIVSAGETQTQGESRMSEAVWSAGNETIAMTEMLEEGGEEATAMSQMPWKTPRITDLTEAFAVILQGATKEFIAGYVIDESFLMWLDAQYGEDTIVEIAYCVMEQEMDVNEWYELTGNSIHVLWLLYCQDTGFQSYRLDNVYWIDCQSSEEIVISFSGDFNFADDWCTTEYMEAQPNGIYDCFSEDLLAEMNESDIMMMNNEFTYSDRGTPLSGKDYTFRASKDKVELLSVFGADIVNLANNHVYDYGPDALLDTMDQLSEAGVAYVGAGEDLDEASKIVYYVANGKKIAIVSATEIERSKNYTKEATEDACGVLKTLNPDKFTQIIRTAKENSDYVIAVVHWGTEGTLYPDSSQRRLAQTFVEAGADAIIGGHPHRLQGAAFEDGVPVE